jgi:hypothetical protein
MEEDFVFCEAATDFRQLTAVEGYEISQTEAQH